MKLSVIFLLLAVGPMFSLGLKCWSCLGYHETPPPKNNDKARFCVNGNVNLELQDCNFEPGIAPKADEEYRCYEERLTKVFRYYLLTRLVKGCIVEKTTETTGCEKNPQTTKNKKEKEAKPSYIHDGICKCNTDGCNDSLAEGDDPPPVMVTAKNKLTCLSCDGHEGGKKLTVCKKGEVPKPVACNVQVVNGTNQKHVCFSSTFKLENALINDVTWIGCYNESSDFQDTCKRVPYIGERCKCSKKDNCAKVIKWKPDKLSGTLAGPSAGASEIYVESSVVALVTLFSTLLFFSSNSFSSTSTMAGKLLGAHRTRKVII